MWEEDTTKMVRGAKALLIDEISMLDGHLLDVLECMVTIIRCYEEVEAIYRTNSLELSEEMVRDRWSWDLAPWGGLQLIVVGDFFQLPPVASGQDSLLSMSDELDLKIGRQGCYAFESYTWANSNFETIELTEVHRQAEDLELYAFLSDVREGVLDSLPSKHHAVLQAIQRPLSARTDGIIPTELHSKNVVVDTRNREELKRINRKPYNFDALDEVALDYGCYMQPFLNRHNLSLEELVDSAQLRNIHSLHDDKKQMQLSLLVYDAVMASPGVPKHAKQTLQDDMDELRRHAHENFFIRGSRAAEHFVLKENAQVMLLWNLDVKGKLANGSRGIVKSFFPSDGYLHLLKEEMKRREKEKSSNETSPKALANASHPEDQNEKAAGLEAETSSATYDFSSVSDEVLAEVQPWIEKQAEDWLMKEIKEMEKIALSFEHLPYVQFTTGRKRLIRPQSFSKTFRKCGTAIRWQIPLTLAWAVTIHKSQGMTIDLLYVGKRRIGCSYMFRYIMWLTQHCLWYMQIYLIVSLMVRPTWPVQEEKFGNNACGKL